MLGARGTLSLICHDFLRSTTKSNEFYDSSLGPKVY
jgi:hypothetical protein